MPPLLLALDLMDTVVRDPFFHAVPRHLGRSMKQVFRLFDSQAWIAFETGLIDEPTYLSRMFNGPPPAGTSATELRDVIVGAYAYVEGMEQLLGELQGDVRLWVLSNYSPWSAAIRQRLGLDRFFDGYVISHDTGFRKPDPRSYRALLQRAGVRPGEVLFVDDREANVEAARRFGMDGLRFVDAEALRRELQERGLLPG